MVDAPGFLRHPPSHSQGRPESEQEIDRSDALGRQRRPPPPVQPGARPGLKCRMHADEAPACARLLQGAHHREDAAAVRYGPDIMKDGSAAVRAHHVPVKSPGARVETQNSCRLPAASRRHSCQRQKKGASRTNLCPPSPMLFPPQLVGRNSPAFGDAREESELSPPTRRTTAARCLPAFVVFGSAGREPLPVPVLWARLRIGAPASQRPG